MRLLLAALLALGAPSPVSGLKIVVLSGEDAVNIIQKKTAVAPVVEVRDRNDLPVPGVAVTFAVQGGKTAAFAGGAPTLTVTTNAAGQAAAAGFHPLASGAVQIHVQAALQGQTAAATIAQSNFLTAAEAASATGAGAAGGAAGGSSGAAGAAAGAVAAGAAASGGGISATTIGLIGAGVAGGAVAATQLGKSGGSQDNGVFVGAFAGNIQMDFPGCTRVERHSGTLRMEIDTSNGSLAGSNARIDDGIEAVVSTTCSGGGQPGTSLSWGMPTAPVTGSLDNLAFAQQVTGPTTDPSITGTMLFRFAGSATTSAVTGTFQKTVQLFIPGQPTVTGTMTVPVTLTPSP